MPFVCAAFGCSTRSDNSTGISFYKTPKIIRNQGEATEQLSAERRRLWKEALRTKHHLTDDQWEKVFVCSKHFEGGVKAYLHHRDKPGWLPTLYLGDPSTINGEFTRKGEDARTVDDSTRKLAVSKDDKTGKQAVSIDNEGRQKEGHVDDITGQQEVSFGDKTTNQAVRLGDKTRKQTVSLGDKTRKWAVRSVNKTRKKIMIIGNKSRKQAILVGDKSRKQAVLVGDKSRKQAILVGDKSRKQAMTVSDKARKRALNVANKPKTERVFVGEKCGSNIMMEIGRNEPTSGYAPISVNALHLNKEQRMGIAMEEQTEPLSSVDMATSIKCEGWETSASDFNSADFEFAYESVTVKTEIENDEIYGGNDQFEQDKEAMLNDTSGSETFRNKDLYSFTFYEMDTEMVSFYTGLPNFGVLMMLFRLVEDGLVFGRRLLTKENELLLCLIKMRMNNEFRDVAFALYTSTETVQRCFHNTLNLLYKRLDFLLRWPSRQNLQKSVPMCFRNNFGAEKVVIVLDSFQLLTEWRDRDLESGELWLDSTYCPNTLTYLIGITPHGQVTFISAGFNSLTSDKNLIEQSGILDDLLPGDIVMVEKSFKPEGIVNFFQTRQNSTQGKGKGKLHLVDVENAPNMVPVRTHVDCVIGTMVQKFFILGGTVPIGYVKPKTGETVPTIDKLVQVACCLTNLCGSFQET